MSKLYLTKYLTEIVYKAFYFVTLHYCMKKLQITTNLFGKLPQIYSPKMHKFIRYH